MSTRIEKFGIKKVKVFLWVTYFDFNDKVAILLIAYKIMNFLTVFIWF